MIRQDAAVQHSRACAREPADKETVDAMTARVRETRRLWNAHVGVPAEDERPAARPRADPPRGKREVGLGALLGVHLRLQFADPRAGAQAHRVDDPLLGPPAQMGPPVLADAEAADEDRVGAAAPRLDD